MAVSNGYIDYSNNNRTSVVLENDHRNVTMEDGNGTWMGEDYQNPFDLLPVKTTFIILYSVVFLMCFVGNLLVIIVILKHRKMRTITNFFLANLAVADLCVGIFCVLPNLAQHLYPHWVLGKVMCKLYYFVQAMSYAASVNILTIISVERFFAIIYPLRSKQMATMCLLRLAVIMVWAIAASAGIPFLIFYETIDMTESTGNGITFCFPASSYNQKAHVTWLFVFGYVIPLVLMTIMYTCISVVLWRSSQMDGSRKAGGYSTTDAHGHMSAAPKQMKAKKATNGQNVRFADGRENLEMDEKGHVSANDSGSATDEHANLMDTSNRRKVANRLLKRMDSTLSEDIDEETDTDLDYENDWPGSRKRDGKPGSFIPHIRLSFKKNNSNGPVTPSNIAPARAVPRGPPNHASFAKRCQVNTATAKAKQENALLARRRVIRLLIVVIVSFATCVLPYHIRVLWLNYMQPSLSFWKLLISPITFVFYYLNSGLNPLFYAFLSDRFRQCLIEVVTCRDYRARRQMSMSNRTMMHSIT